MPRCESNWRATAQPRIAKYGDALKYAVSLGWRALTREPAEAVRALRKHW